VWFWSNGQWAGWRVKLGWLTDSRRWPREEYIGGYGYGGSSIDVEGIFEHDSLVISFALALGFGTILAGWSFFSALDTPPSTCYGRVVSLNASDVRDGSTYSNILILSASFLVPWTRASWGPFQLHFPAFALILLPRLILVDG